MREYTIIDEETGMDVTTDKFQTLQEVQQELNDIKKIAKETLYFSVENFMSSRILVFNDTKFISYLGNKRI